MARCECGCGQTVTKGRRFVWGHNLRGRAPWNKGKKCPWAKNLPQAFKKGQKPWNHGVYGEGAPMYGKKQSDFQKKRCSETHLGLEHSESSKRQMSETRKRLLSEGKVKVWNKGLTGKEDSRIHYGKSHYRWNNGKTPLLKALRTSSKYKAWRESIFLRDNYTCQECGKRGGYLEAHHVKPFVSYPDLRFEIDNGISYCNACHSKIDKCRGLIASGISS